MPAPVTIELYVAATLEEVARTLSLGPLPGELAVVPEGTLRPTPWTRSLPAWRQDVRWQRGRAAGTGTVDLVAAGEARTLLVVSLRPSRSWLGRAAIPAGKVTALARAIRRTAEDGHVTHRRDRRAVDGLAPHVAAPVPVHPTPAAVGYSGP